ncbi:hypothetical protein N9219_00635 [bacterium]|nr:hypothetical protein [bacterium]
MAYVLGFQNLGHKVYLMEDIDPKRCHDSNFNPVSFEKWEGRFRFESLTQFYGIWPRCCLIYNNGEDTHGMSFKKAVKVAKASDLLINIQARLKTRDILENVRCRAYIDINPAKTQVYQAEYGIDRGFDKHDYFFTVGLNIGTPRCDIPTCGLTWYGIMPPVVLSLWPVNIDDIGKRFTTISNWVGKNTFNFKGRYSGEKVNNWLKVIELPNKTSQELEIALNINPAYDKEIKLFKKNGWVLSDPKQLSTLEDYRRYIATSRAEFSIANNRYVQFNTGWFSDRSARYLASGKPVLVQSTGIEDQLPMGKGLLTFKTMEEAVAGIEAINSDYLAHCQAARSIAEKHFDSDKVLSNMLKQIGF